MFNYYMPVLRAKEGEIKALGWLSQHSKSFLRPLIDIPKPKEGDSQSLAEFLCQKVTSLTNSWGIDHPIFLDLSRYEPESRAEEDIHPIENVFHSARQSKLSAIPVTGTLSNRGPGADYLDAVAKIAGITGRGVALRLTFDEFSNQNYIKELVEKNLKLLNVKPGNCDLILDLEALDRQTECKKVSDLAEVLRTAIFAIDDQGFRSVAMCGSSVPEEVGTDFNEKPCEVDRVDFAVWKSLVANVRLQDIVFGDYGIIYPLIKDNPTSGPPPGRVRLSTDTKHILHRAPRINYRSLTRKVAADEVFKLQAECWGKKCIAGRGAGYTGVGGPADWVARDTNCHIESTLKFIRMFLLNSEIPALGETSEQTMDLVPQSELEFSEEFIESA